MAYLPSVLGALGIAKDTEIEVIVVDGGSSDDSHGFCSKHPAVNLVLKCDGGTPGAVRNRGAQQARGAYLCFVDADCLVAPNYFSEIREAISRGLACFGSQYGLPDNPKWIEWAWHGLHRRATDGRVAYLNGGNLIVHRTAFERVGGFSETMVSGEDYDLCQRLAAIGTETHSVASIRVTHLGNPKTLAAFFRQQVWHALGTFGRGGRALVGDMPFAAAMAHLVAHLAFFAALIAGPSGMTATVLTFGLPFVVPVAATIARASQSRRTDVIAPGVLLYYLYLSARVLALISYAAGRAGVFEWRWQDRKRT